MDTKDDRTKIHPKLIACKACYVKTALECMDRIQIRSCPAKLESYEEKKVLLKP